MSDKRDDEWRIEQYNRNRPVEDHISTIEELEEILKVSDEYWCVSSVVDFEYVESNAVNTK